jgi:hypothetical protein
VLANDLPPFDPRCGETQGINHGQFYEALVRNLFHKSIAVYRATAFVLGMCLRALSASNDPSQVRECAARACRSFLWVSEVGV